MMTQGAGESSIEATFLANRAVLMAFLRSRDAADAADDIFQEMWLRLPRDAEAAGRIRAPLSYLYRMANSIIVDRYRQRRFAGQRERHWAEANDVATEVSAQPTADRQVAGRQMLDHVLGILDGQGERARRAFWLHRVDGLTQREVAAALDVSLSTVEGDLRAVYRQIALARAHWDKANAG